MLATAHVLHAFEGLGPEEPVAPLTRPALEGTTDYHRGTAFHPMVVAGLATAPRASKRLRSLYDPTSA